MITKSIFIYIMSLSLAVTPRSFSLNNKITPDQEAVYFYSIAAL
jgi:hypothetical protein